MLSKITRAFGSIFTSLKNLGAHPVNPNAYVPFTTFAIVGINIGLFLFGFRVPMVLPDLWSHPLHLLTYQFSHGGFPHLFGNMLFLLFTAPSVEKFLGHIKFGIFYLVCGCVSAIAFLSVYSAASLVGASGAIAGVIAVYPFVQRTFLGLLFSGAVALFLFYSNFMEALGSIASQMPLDVAQLAHVAGGVMGLIMFCFFQRKSTPIQA